VRDRPLFSVITPVYNCEKYVADAIRCVQAQTLGAENIEHIIVDDGSSDNTAQIVRSFGNAVRFIQVEHGGVSRARNVAIHAATAPYVALLDGDDYWFPQYLERVLELFRREERIFVVVEGYVETPDARQRGEPTYHSQGFECLFELDAPAQFEFALEDNFISIFSTMPRDAVIQAGGFNTHLHYGEDWDLWLRLLKLGYAARLVKEPLRIYRRHPGSATSYYSVQSARDRIYVLAKYRDAVSPYRWHFAHSTLLKASLRAFLSRLHVLPSHRAAV
jgi:glycosyltransferase involved in cell wall biosynthesis